MIVGDNGGALTAFHGGRDGGTRANLFLTDGALNPKRCDEIESTGDAPAVTHSPRVLLTRTPEIRTGERAWHNFQGAATGMAVSNGYLYSGYIDAGMAPSSALTIFRTAKNLSVLSLTVQDVNGSPIGRGTVLRPGDQVRAAIEVRLEGDAYAGPQTVPLAVGWTSEGPEVRTVTLEPFRNHTEQFVLTVPTQAADLQIMAVANPSLYGARRDRDEAAGLTAPGVQHAPDPLPAVWESSLAWAVLEPAAFGEVWALDNARSWAQPYQCDLTVRIDGPEPGAAVSQEEFQVAATVTRQGCGPVPSVAVTVTGAPGRANAAFSNPGQREAGVTLTVYPEVCGPLTLTAEVDPFGRIPELNEENNRDVLTVKVEGCERTQPSGCPPDVSPEKCRGSKPTS